MALVRLSATTALPTTRQIIGDLDRCAKDGGTFASSQAIKDGLSTLLIESQRLVLQVDLVLSPAFQLDAIDSLCRWLLPGGNLESFRMALQTHQTLLLPSTGKGPEICYSLWSMSEPPVRRAGSLRAPILVLIMQSLDEASENIKNALDALCEDRPIAMLFTQRSSNDSSRIPIQLCASAWHFETYDISTPPGDSLREKLNSPPWDAVLDVLRAYSISGSSESLATVLGLGIEQEIRGLKAKRSVAQQRIAKLQQKSGQLTAGEMTSDLRSRIQRQFADFERGAGDRFQALIAPQVGTLTQELDQRLNNLSDLESENRAKTTSYRIPGDFEKTYTSYLREGLTRQVQSDLVAMQDLFRILQVDIEKQITAGGGPPVTLNFRLIDEDRVARMLQSSIVFQRSYQSDLTRQGFFEYAMMARRYLMILFMFISAFGLSFLRGYREFMIPTSVLLLSIGGMMVVRSVKRERIEVMEKELEKARESLRAETKRIFSEVQRAWSAMISQHLSDQNQAAISQMEASIRSAQTQRANDSTEEKLRVQRQLQMLENSERKLQIAAKNKEVILNAISQIKGELRQLVIGVARQTLRAVI